MSEAWDALVAQVAELQDQVAAPVKLDDLPLADLQRSLAATLTPDADTFLMPKTVGTDSIKDNTVTAGNLVNALVAPTTGTHAVGEIVWNSVPAAGGKIGWVCTTPGTPGTWKAFGPIDP